MQNRKLAILGMGFISAVGDDFESLEKAFSGSKALFGQDKDGLYFPIPERYDAQIEQSAATLHGGARLDRTVKLALTATAACLKNTHTPIPEKVLVNIGSSRGATHTWETEFGSFLEQGKSSPKASPYTTPGNISSNVAALLTQESIVVDHSVTCGSGLQALANAAAWLRSGMAHVALAGGAESPLTPFTRAQMQALKITSSSHDDFPVKPLSAQNPKTGMLLGEGAAVFALGKAENYPNQDFYITGIGLANERGSSPSGITGEGKALYGSMHAALADAGIERPDVIITHAPGTEKGDQAELNAIRHLFGENYPRLFTNKHMLGHTLGASGTLSVITACYILQHNKTPNLPYEAVGQHETSTSIRSVLINATGFGGNAVSVVVQK